MIGNFWVDLTRTTLYIFLPLALVLALIQVSQGVVQNFTAYQTVPLVQPTSYEQTKLDADGNPVKDANGNEVKETVQVTQQTLPMGPAASQIAIKQLGTNGGGFFNVNSAHPFENPTPRSARTRRSAMLRRVAIWKEKRCASASPTRRCGPRQPQPPRMARSTRCTIVTRRWVGWCRCL